MKKKVNRFIILLLSIIFLTSSLPGFSVKASTMPAGPTITANGGVGPFTEPQTVTIDGGEGATGVYFTFNDIPPTFIDELASQSSNMRQYWAPFTINQTERIQAMSVSGGYSDVTSVLFVFNSAIIPTTATYNLNPSGSNNGDIIFELILKGNTLSCIKNGTATLTPDTDYTVSNGNMVTIPKSYLAKQSVGTTTLTFGFSNGDPVAIPITVQDAAPPVSPAAIMFDKNPDGAAYADVPVIMTLNGTFLDNIKNGAATLTPGTDYTVSGSTVTIPKSYLDKQSVGTATLTFGFSAGDPATVAITVQDTRYRDSSVNPDYITFDKNPDGAAYADIPVTMTLNSNTFLDIKNGAATLTRDTDYTVSGNTVTLLKSYLANNLGYGMTTLTFGFSGAGSTAAPVTLKINVVRSISKNSGVISSTPAYDKNGNLYIAESENNRIVEVAAVTGTQWGMSITAGKTYVIAGKGSSGYSGDGGSATEAELNEPQDVTLDGDGNLYIADTKNNRVRKVSASTGDISTVAGNGSLNTLLSGDGGSPTDAAIFRPYSVAVDTSGNLYIYHYADNGGAVREVAAVTGTQWGGINMEAGKIYTVAGNQSNNSGAAELYSDGIAATAAVLSADPGSVTLDKDGNLYIFENFGIYGGAILRKVMAGTGKIYTVSGGEYYLPTINYMGDDGSSAAHAQIGSNDVNKCQRTVAVDADGNIYFVDVDNQAIREVAAKDGIQWGIVMTAGSIYTIAGGGKDNEYFAGFAPCGVAVDAAGNLCMTAGYGGVYVLNQAQYPSISPRKVTFDQSGGPNYVNIPITITPNGAHLLNIVNRYSFTPYHGEPGKLEASCPLYLQPGIDYTVTGNQINIMRYYLVRTLGAYPLIHRPVKPIQLAFIFDNGAVANIDIEVANTLNSPFLAGSMTVDPAGNLYVADNCGNLSKYDPRWEKRDDIISGKSGIDTPINTIEVDAAGNLYWVELNGVVSELAAQDGNQFGIEMKKGNIYTLPIGVPSCYSLDVDSAGNLYAAGLYSHRVFELAAQDGNQFGIAMTKGKAYTVATLDKNPFDVAVDKDGNLYIGVTNETTYPTGNFCEVIELAAQDGINQFGMAMTKGNTYTLLTTGFSFPMCVAVDKDGNVYVGDNESQSHFGAAVLELPAKTGEQWGIPMTAGNVCPIANGLIFVLMDLDVDAAGNLYIFDMPNFASPYPQLFYGMNRVVVMKRNINYYNGDPTYTDPTHAVLYSLNGAGGSPEDPCYLPVAYEHVPIFFGDLGDSRECIVRHMYAPGSTVTLLDQYDRSNPNNIINCINDKGRTFVGWNTKSDGTGTSYAPGATLTMPNTAVFLYAMFSPSKVTYNGNGSTGGTVPVDSSSHEQGTAVIVPGNTGNLVKTGYTFGGWSYSSVVGAVYQPDETFTMPAGNIIMYAVWNAGQTNTVTYNGNGGTGTAPTESDKAAGATFTAAANSFTAPSGKQFKEWNTESDGTGDSYAAGAEVTMPASSLTLNAIWEDIPAVTYTVTYDGNGGTGTAPTESDKAEGATFTAAANSFAAPSGKQFKEWNTESDGTGDSYAAGGEVTMPANNLILYAIWEDIPAVTYTVTYNGNGGTGTAPTESDKAEGATFTAAANSFAAPSGKQFKEWNTESDGTGDSYAAGGEVTMPASSLTLNAIWEDIPVTTYHVTYNANGGMGTAPAESDKAEGATFTAAAANSFTPPSGKQFKEWNTAANGSGTSYLAGATVIMPASNLTLYAIWEPMPTVTSITVAPPTVSVQKGTTQTFTATVSGTNNPVQTVTWSVYGNISGNTAINASGLLTVAADETAATLTVTATSAMDNTKSGTATVTVTTTPPAFVPVTLITGVPTTATAGTPLTLSGTATPANATNQTIVWRVQNAGTTGATVSGNTLSATAAGTVTVRATITNGLTESTDYTQDFNITVSAAPVTTYTVTASAGSGGSISPNGSVSVTEGSNQTFTITSNSGYQINSVTVDGAPQGAITTYTFTNVTAKHTINATFTSTSGGGGGGGGGGGSPSTPTTPTAPTYNADVKAGNGNETTLPVTVDKDNGTASTNVGSQKLTSSGTVITVPSIPDVDTYSVGIPVPNLSTSDAQGTLTFHTDNGSVTVPSNMLTGVSDISGSKAEITIGQGNKENLPEDVKAAIGDKTLIQLTLSIDGNQTDWSNRNAPVTVSIPYTPTAAELANPESIVVWYIDGSGNVVTIPNGHYDPATGRVTFDTTHFSDYAVAYNPVNFKDVAASAWYSKAVGFIAARGITSGTGNGKYSPEAKLTRGEFLVMMMKAYDIAPDANPKDNFSDAGNTYYTGYLAAAKRLGISTGVGNNMFAPGKEITRQEMFTLLYNSLKLISKLPQGNAGKPLSSFGDAGQVASWAKDAMTLLVETGTIGGNAGKLSPTSTTTRAEMAQVLYNLLSK